MEKFTDYEIIAVVKEIDRIMPNFIGFLEYLWKKRLKSEMEFRIGLNDFKTALARFPKIPFLQIYEGEGIRKRGRPKKAKIRIVG